MQIPMAGDEQSDRVGRHSPSTDAKVDMGSKTSVRGERGSRKERTRRESSVALLAPTEEKIPTSTEATRAKWGIGKKTEDMEFSIYLKNILLERFYNGIRKNFMETNHRALTVCVYCVVDCSRSKCPFYCSCSILLLSIHFL